MEEITEATDRGNDVNIIRYLDFCKVFDKVPHRRLLIKLQGYGIKGKLFEWIKDFLPNRRQQAVVHGTCSDWIPVTCWTHRGSVLDPVLFLIFIKSLPEVLRCCKKLFANDGKIYSSIREVQDEVRLIVYLFTFQGKVNNSANWAQIWNIDFNTKNVSTRGLAKSNQPSHTLCHLVQKQSG